MQIVYKNVFFFKHLSSIYHSYYFPIGVVPSPNSHEHFVFTVMLSFLQRISYCKNIKSLILRANDIFKYWDESSSIIYMDFLSQKFRVQFWPFLSFLEGLEAKRTKSTNEILSRVVDEHIRESPPLFLGLPSSATMVPLNLRCW